MTPEEWARVRDIFDSALAQNADDRDAFLERECAGNPGLRDEVASLLAALDGADDFIESPAFEVAADLFVEDPGPSLSGRRVGPYLVRHEIGRGGMGVVYLADDTRLSRRVALKAILPEFQSDSGRRERLRQEARAAAGLSHPGIATVYAIEEIDNQLYLASEYVAGPTLRAIIESGPMPAASGARRGDATGACPRRRPRAGSRSPRSEAREHRQNCVRRNQGVGFRSCPD